jgi:hypothetical protein
VSPQQGSIRREGGEGAAGFTAQDSAVAAQALAAGEKLLRVVQKKLQQVGQLEEKLSAQGVHALDAQQMAKVGSKPALLEALEALQAGVPWQEVQDRLQHAQEVAAKLAAAADAGSMAAGSGPQHQQGGGSSSSKSRQPSTPASGQPSSSKKLDSLTSSTTSQQASLHQQQQSSSNAKETATPAAVQKSSSASVQSTQSPAMTANDLGDASSTASRLIALAASTPPPPSTRTAAAAAASSGSASSSKEKSAPRKGDLSAFLSGALDATKWQQQQQRA